MKTKKGTIEWKKQKYLQACRILDAHNKLANYCKIRIEDGRLTCNGSSKDKETLCCSNCSHLGKNGCETNSLACKLSYCYVNTGPEDNELCFTEKDYQNSKRQYRLYWIIRSFFIINNIPLFMHRMSMEDTFKINSGRKSLDNYDTNSAEFF